MKGLLLLFAKRYIAGTERKDAIDTALRLNRLGIKAVIDNLGENIENRMEADASVREYLALMDDIKKSGADSTVSLKLTHLGLDISAELAKDNAEKILAKAAELGNLVRFDMEGSAYTQRTIDAFLALRPKYPNLGIAIQSYLLRSMDDIKSITKAGGSIRLVKGAYKEPPGIAYQHKKDVDANYERLMKELIEHGHHPAIATHDERLINEAKRFSSERKITSDFFDFEMLLGIKREQQRRLANEGYTVRVYVPYGREWLPYMLRRFRERKENIWFVVKNLLD